MTPTEHAEPSDHEHLPGDGHETVVHGDHVDHLHDGERHPEAKIHPTTAPRTPRTTGARPSSTATTSTMSTTATGTSSMATTFTSIDPAVGRRGRQPDDRP